MIDSRLQFCTFTSESLPPTFSSILKGRIHLVQKQFIESTLLDSGRRIQLDTVRYYNLAKEGEEIPQEKS